MNLYPNFKLEKFRKTYHGHVKAVRKKVQTQTRQIVMLPKKSLVVKYSATPVWAGRTPLAMLECVSGATSQYTLSTTEMR